jgi:hypothetical protein
MDLQINYWAIVVCGVLAMVVGFIWYGPLFGRLWMRLSGANPDDLAKRKEMQKAAGPLYVLHFVLVLFQAYVLAHYIAGWTDASGVENALWIWAAFVMPTIAGTSMWTNDSTKVKWTKFLLQAGYQLVMFVIFGFTLGMWK